MSAAVRVGPGTPDAVFVLDFLTGRLTGAMLNPTSGIFTNYYFRNVAADFIVDPNAKAKHAMIPGDGFLNTGAGLTTASGVLYVGELSSGKVVAYRFPYRNSRVVIEEIMPLDPFAYYMFRETESNE